MKPLKVESLDAIESANGLYREVMPYSYVSLVSNALDQPDCYQVGGLDCYRTVMITEDTSDLQYQQVNTKNRFPLLRKFYP